MANSSAFNLESLVVNTKAATVYAAHESSLFLPGAIIPQIAVPAGSITAQVPFLNTGSAAEVDASGAAFGADDFTSNAVTDSSKTITAKVFAARTILRDIGGIDPSEVGRVLGNSVSRKFDQAVAALMTDATLTTHAQINGSGGSNLLIANDIFKAAATLRGAGVGEKLYAVLHPEQVFELMKSITTSAFAGSNAQNEAMASGFVGYIAGVEIYQSSYIGVDGQNNRLGAVFGQDAFRIAMFKNVDLEVQRRASAVGNDIVASLHAGVGLVDPNRGVAIASAGF
jgi:hypothetical protein